MTMALAAQFTKQIGMGDEKLNPEARRRAEGPGEKSLGGIFPLPWSPFHGWRGELNSYLRFSNLEVGLLLNFRSWPLEDGGIKGSSTPMLDHSPGTSEDLRASGLSFLSPLPKRSGEEVAMCAEGATTPTLFRVPPKALHACGRIGSLTMQRQQG